MKERNTYKKRIRLIKPVKWIGAILLFLIIAVIILKLAGIVKNNKVKTTVITSTQLQEILQISDLSAYSVVYNGIACVYNEKNEPAYYVSYDSEVKLGIDMADIAVSIEEVKASDEAESVKKVVVTLPEIHIKDILVDMASLDYMFFDKSYETKDVSSQAYAACIADVGEESRANEEIYEFARNNCENVVSALIKPVIEGQDEQYILEIR